LFGSGFTSDGNFKHRWHRKLGSSVGAVLIGQAGLFSALLDIIKLFSYYVLGSTKLSLITAFFLGLSNGYAFAQEDSVSPAATSEQAEVNATGLQRIEDGSVVSNEHTVKWRIFTDNGRESIQKAMHARHWKLWRQLDKAGKLFQAALLEAKEGFGLRDPHVASALNNLAEFYRLTKEYEKAELLYLEAIEILEESYGSDDIRVGTALHSLGMCYHLQHKFAQAQTCYEVLSLQGKRRGAESLIEESIRILEEAGLGESTTCIQRMTYLSTGWDSLHTTSAAELLGLNLQALGKLKESEELFERSLAARKNILPEGHFLVAVTLVHLARLTLHKFLSDLNNANRDVAKYYLAKAQQLSNDSISRVLMKIIDNSMVPQFMPYTCWLTKRHLTTVESPWQILLPAYMRAQKHASMAGGASSDTDGRDFVDGGTPGNAFGGTTGDGHPASSGDGSNTTGGEDGAKSSGCSDGGAGGVSASLICSEGDVDVASGRKEALEPTLLSCAKIHGAMKSACRTRVGSAPGRGGFSAASEWKGVDIGGTGVTDSCDGGSSTMVDSNGGEDGSDVGRGGVVAVTGAEDVEAGGAAWVAEGDVAVADGHTNNSLGVVNAGDASAATSCGEVVITADGNGIVVVAVAGDDAVGVSGSVAPDSSSGSTTRDATDKGGTEGASLTVFCCIFSSNARILRKRITEGILNSSSKDQNKLNSTSATDRDKIAATATLLQALDVIGLIDIAAKRVLAPGELDYRSIEDALHKCISLYREPDTRSLVTKVVKQDYMRCLSMLVEYNLLEQQTTELQELLGEARQIIHELGEESNRK
ncbi:hypothetical protein BAE44_0014401, partial [Dichanthelium oligosanthes]